MNGEQEKELFKSIGAIEATVKGNARQLDDQKDQLKCIDRKLSDYNVDLAVTKERVKSARKAAGAASVPGSGSLLWNVIDWIKGIFQ